MSKIYFSLPKARPIYKKILLLSLLFTLGLSLNILSSFANIAPDDQTKPANDKIVINTVFVSTNNRADDCKEDCSQDTSANMNSNPTYLIEIMQDQKNKNSTPPSGGMKIANVLMGVDSEENNSSSTSVQVGDSSAGTVATTQSATPAISRSSFSKKTFSLSPEEVTSVDGASSAGYDASQTAPFDFANIPPELLQAMDAATNILLSLDSTEGPEKFFSKITQSSDFINDLVVIAEKAKEAGVPTVKEVTSKDIVDFFGSQSPSITNFLNQVLYPFCLNMQDFLKRNSPLPTDPMLRVAVFIQAATQYLPQSFFTSLTGAIATFTIEQSTSATPQSVAATGTVDATGAVITDFGTLSNDSSRLVSGLQEVLSAKPISAAANNFWSVCSSLLVGQKVQSYSDIMHILTTSDDFANSVVGLVDEINNPVERVKKISAAEVSTFLLTNDAYIHHFLVDTLQGLLPFDQYVDQNLGVILIDKLNSKLSTNDTKGNNFWMRLFLAHSEFINDYLPNRDEHGPRRFYGDFLDDDSSNNPNTYNDDCAYPFYPNDGNPYGVFGPSYTSNLPSVQNFATEGRCPLRWLGVDVKVVGWTSLACILLSLVLNINSSQPYNSY